MAISVAVPVGDKVADALVERLKPRVEALKIGPATDKDAQMGPIVSKAQRDKIVGYIDSGVSEGAKLVVDGRGFKLQGYENGFFVGGTLFDHGQFVAREPNNPVNRALSTWKEISAPHKIERTGIPATGV